MNIIKRLKLNESLSAKELIDELRNDAKYIVVEYIDKQNGWGVCYMKNKKKVREGGFNTAIEVHNFLCDNDIDYQGKDGYLMIKKIRDEQNVTIPYKKYQQEILNKGIKNLFDIE
jgi:hypothetical protein